MTAPRGSDFEGTVEIFGDSEIEQCRLCSNGLKDPRILPCFHTFCAGCIQNAISSSVDHEKFLCPLCKSVLCKPKDGVEGFPENMYARAEGRSSKPSNCQACETNPANKRCLECEEFYCPGCSTAHLKMKASRNHNLTDIQAGNARYVRPRLCPKHKTEDLGFYCTDCGIPICFKCNMTVHKSHECEDLDHKAAAIRERLGEEINTMRSERKNVHHSRIETMKISKTKLAEDLANYKQEIMKRVKIIQDQLEAYAQKQMEDLEAAIKRQSLILERKIKEQENKMESLVSQMSEMCRYLRNASSTEVIDMHEIISSILAEYKNDCHTYIEEIFASKPVPNGDLSETTLKNICGKAKINIKTKRPVHFQKMRQVSINMEKKAQKVNAVLPLINGEVLFSVLGDEGRSLWKVQQTGGIRKILDTNDCVGKVMKDKYGNIFVQTSSCLIKLGLDNNSNESIVMPELPKLFDITADNVLYMWSRSGVVYTYDWNEKQFIPVHKNLELCKKPFGAMALSKSGIAFLTLEGTGLFVCGSNFSSNEMIVKENCDFIDIVSAEDGHMFAADESNNCVHLLTEDGRYLQRIPFAEDCKICGDISIDDSGQFWIGCQDKLAVFRIG